MEISTNITFPTNRRNFLKLAGGVAVAGVWTHSTGIIALAQERHQQRPDAIIPALKPRFWESARL